MNNLNIKDLQKFDKEYLISIIIELNNKIQELENQLKKNSTNSSKPPYLLRDLIFCMEVEKSKWAYKAKKFFLNSEKAREAIWKKGFNPLLKGRIISQYQRNLEHLIEEPLMGKESRKLQKRFKKHKEKILYFMNDPDIPWHNNSSERAIRNSKLYQKISGCFRSIKGAKRRAVILSIIETCKKRKLNILTSLQRIFQGNFCWTT